MEIGAHKKKIVFAAAGLCVVILAAAAAFWPGEKEPEYKGKKLSEWIEEDRSNPSVKEAIVAIGTNSLPLLVKWASYEPSKLRDLLNKALDELPARIRYNRAVEWVFRDRGDERGGIAAETFWVLGPRGNPVIKDLAAIVREKTNLYAFISLKRIGEAAFPRLAEMANDKGFSGRALAVLCIGDMEKLGTNEMACVQLLCALANDSDKIIQRIALSGLGNLGLQPDLALKTLLKFASDESTALSGIAISAIGNFGTNARPVGSQLIGFLDHKNPDVRNAATNAINKIAPEFFATNGIVIPKGLGRF
jgi:hypothetical protein